MKAKRAILVPALVITATACADMGLEGNVARDEAVHRAPPPLEATVMAPDTVEPARLVVEGRLWVPDGRPTARDPAALRPVGSVDGHTVHARRWDQPPYGALFVRTAPSGSTEREEWQEFAPVVGRSWRAPAGGS